MVCEELKNHIESMAIGIINIMPGKRFEGHYYHYWYDYPELQVGYNAERYYSWVNYDSGTGAISDFTWYPIIDDQLTR